MALTASAAPAAVPPVLGTAQPDEALARLFSPATAPPGIYEVYRSPEAIERIAARLQALDRDPHADAWRVLPAEPIMAFGSEGRYDRARLARVFAGQRPRVARGMLRDGATMTAYTLVAPIPDAALDDLHPETLIIVTHVEKLVRVGR
jgi:hypothetical protein